MTWGSLLHAYYILGESYFSFGQIVTRITTIDRGSLYINPFQVSFYLFIVMLHVYFTYTVIVMSMLSLMNTFMQVMCKVWLKIEFCAPWHLISHKMSMMKKHNNLTIKSLSISCFTPLVGIALMQCFNCRCKECHDHLTINLTRLHCEVCKAIVFPCV